MDWSGRPELIVYKAVRGNRVDFRMEQGQQHRLGLSLVQATARVWRACGSVVYVIVSCRADFICWAILLVSLSLRGETPRRVDVGK
jgi:hypothetical protein